MRVEPGSRRGCSVCLRALAEPPAPAAPPRLFLLRDFSCPQRAAAGNTRCERAGVAPPPGCSGGTGSVHSPPALALYPLLPPTLGLMMTFGWKAWSDLATVPD